MRRWYGAYISTTLDNYQSPFTYREAGKRAFYLRICGKETRKNQ